MMRSLALLLAIAVLPVFAQDPARVVKPEIRVGDSWTYRNTNLFAQGTHTIESRVSFSDGKTILLVSTGKSDDKEVDSSWTAEWNAVRPVGDIVFRPDSGMFRFPLRVGDKYDVKYDILRPKLNRLENRTTGTVTVAGWENVEVPAGKFRALRLELDSTVETVDGTRNFRRQSTFWYVPEVRRWVKLSVTAPRLSAGEELLSYKLNED
jgi:hypothetical protein